MVKTIRTAINGHKKLVGGLSASALIVLLAGRLTSERYDKISRAADRVPVIDAWIEGHERWTEGVYPEVLAKISVVNERVTEKGDSIEAQIAVNVESLGEWKRDRTESDKEWRAEQRERNREMLHILRKLEERSPGP